MKHGLNTEERFKKRLKKLCGKMLRNRSHEYRSKCVTVIMAHTVIENIICISKLLFYNTKKAALNVSGGLIIQKKTTQYSFLSFIVCGLHVLVTKNAADPTSWNLYTAKLCPSAESRNTRVHTHAHARVGLRKLYRTFFFTWSADYSRVGRTS